MKKIILIDLFCGAGGVTTGFENAKLEKKKVAQVLACVNHDAGAIQSHYANHPHVKHYTEDIKKLGLSGLISMVKGLRKKEPQSVIVVWASLECTNFSKAKGGMPRDADSRTLAEHLYRYLESINPDYLLIENVAEFMSWGPLDDKGKPVSKQNGRDYLAWIEHICSYGYDFNHKMLNSANYGAYTSRDRFFGIFSKKDMPVAWPKATHSKNPTKDDMFGAGLKKWKAVKEVLDLNDHGYSIFDRKNNLTIPKRNRKDLVEKTLARIYAGLIKHVAGGKDQFLASYYGNGDNINDIDIPAGTLTTKDRCALVSTQFIAKYYSGRPEGKCISVDGPAGTIKTSDGQSLITCNQFLDKQYGGSVHNHQSIEVPSGTIMSYDKHSLVTPYIMDTNFNNTGSPIENPLPVITANRKYHYLVNPQYTSAGGSTEKPCFTLIARMDKMPPYLVTTEEGFMAIEIFSTDSEFTIKIKEFMALYGIVDIKMRMLKIPELLKIQGFPDGYVLIGSQADQKKFIGNSVVPLVAQKICEALAEILFTNKTKQIAA